MKFEIKDTFNKELDADPINENYIRQVHNACFSYVNPTPCSNPTLIHYSTDIMDAIGLNVEDVQTDEFYKYLQVIKYIHLLVLMLCATAVISLVIGLDSWVTEGL